MHIVRTKCTPEKLNWCSLQTNCILKPASKIILKGCSVRKWLLEIPRFHYKEKPDSAFYSRRRQGLPGQFVEEAVESKVGSLSLNRST